MICQGLLLPLALLTAAQSAGGAMTSTGTSVKARDASKEVTYARWRIEDKFDNGIPSWQSYPLAQDIGYDPSLYTTKIAGQPALRRDVISDGQSMQVVGLIRPLSFSLTASSRLALVYSIEASGHADNVKIVLASRDGVRYKVLLPLSAHSPSKALLDGSLFHLRGGQAHIEAVVVSFTVRHAPPGSHSFLTLRSFSVDATAPAAPTMLSPRMLLSSTGDEPVADRVVQTGTPTVFTFASAPAQVTTEDGEGQMVPCAVALQGKRVSWTPTRNASPGLWTVTVAGAHGSLAFRILVLGDASAASGILFSSERLAELRTEDRFLNLRQAIHAEAVKRAQELKFSPEAGRSIALLPSESVFAGLPGYANLMDKYGAAISYNALDYRLNGDLRALEIVRRALLTVSAWQTWTPAWFTAHGIHTYYVVGVFTERLALGYDLVSDQLASDERHAVEDATMRNSIQPTIDDYYLKQRMPTGGSNHMAHSLGGAVAAWAAFDRVDPDWRRTHGTSLGELIAGFEILLKGLYPGDGSEAEPAGYEVFAMEGVTYGVSSLATLGIVPRNLQTVMDSFWWLRYAEVSPKLVLDTGDTRSTLPSLYSYAWVAEHSADPGARWFYDTLERPLLDAVPQGIRTPDTSSTLQQAPNVLDLLCCSRPRAPFTAPTPSRIFAQRGSVSLRDSWDDPEMAASIRIGPWMNHEHHDQGSFQVAVHGQLLVGEGGYADYYQDPNYKTYFSEAPAHNVVLVDHDPFSQVPYDGRYWKALSDHPKLTSSLLGNGVDYVEADLKPAYGEALKGYKRQFLFLKPGLLIVSDDLESPAAHVFDWLLHLAPGERVQQRESQVVISTPQTSESLTLMAIDPHLSWRVSTTPIAVNEFSDLDEKPVDQRQVLSLDSAAAARQNFLVGLSASGAEQAISIERRKTRNGQGFLQSSPGQQALALFRSGQGPLEASGASTDGDVLALVTLSSQDKTSFFAAHTLSLTIGASGGISLSVPGNVLWDQGGGSVTLFVAVEQPCRLTLHATIRDDSMRLDGRAESGFSQGGGIALTTGSHRLEFLLATAASKSTVQQEGQLMPGKTKKP
jgi:hypothetical protein